MYIYICICIYSNTLQLQQKILARCHWLYVQLCLAKTIEGLPAMLTNVRWYHVQYVPTNEHGYHKIDGIEHISCKI